MQESKGIVLDLNNPEQQTKMQQNFENRLRGFEGTIGYIYLTLEHQLEELQRQLASTSEDQKADINFQISQIATMLTQLDVDLGIVEKNIDRKEQLGTQKISNTQARAHLEQISKEQILKQTSLEQALAKIRVIMNKNTPNSQDDSEQLNQRVAAQQLISMIEKVLRESKAA